MSERNVRERSGKLRKRKNWRKGHTENKAGCEKKESGHASRDRSKKKSFFQGAVLVLSI